MTTPQKDTPTSGGTAPDHESVEDHLRNLAHGNRARLLAKAALFAYDPVTGEKLAESMPGQPNTLQK
jgi:hypothetical protein